MKTSSSKIIELIKREIDSRIDFENLRTDIELSEQGLDSLDHSTLFLAIDEEYGVEVSDDEIDELTTIDKIVNFINLKN